MSLDVYLMETSPHEVYERNITHNLGEMARQAKCYDACWYPENINAKYARDIIPILELALRDLRARPDFFRQFDAKNGWGLYEHFVEFVADYLKGCQEHPNAEIKVSR